MEKNDHLWYFLDKKEIQIYNSYFSSSPFELIHSVKTS